MLDDLLIYLLFLLLEQAGSLRPTAVNPAILDWSVACTLYGGMYLQKSVLLCVV